MTLRISKRAIVALLIIGAILVSCAVFLLSGPSGTGLTIDFQTKSFLSDKVTDVTDASLLGGVRLNPFEARG